MSDWQTLRTDPGSESGPASAGANPFAPPRAHLGSGGGKPRILAYQRAGRVLRLLAILGLVATIAIIVLLFQSPWPPGRMPTPPALLAMGVAIILEAFMFFAAAAIMRHKTWGRWAGILYALVSLLGFPLGTLIGGYLLWRLVWGWADQPGD